MSNFITAVLIFGASVMGSTAGELHRMSSGNPGLTVKHLVRKIFASIVAGFSCGLISMEYWDAPGANIGASSAMSLFGYTIIDAAVGAIVSRLKTADIHISFKGFTFKIERNDNNTKNQEQNNSQIKKEENSGGRGDLDD